MEILRAENVSEKYQAENGEINAFESVSFGVEKGSSSASSGRPAAAKVRFCRSLPGW